VLTEKISALYPVTKYQVANKPTISIRAPAPALISVPVSVSAPTSPVPCCSMCWCRCYCVLYRYRQNGDPVISPYRYVRTDRRFAILKVRQDIYYCYFQIETLEPGKLTICSSLSLKFNSGCKTKSCRRWWANGSVCFLSHVILVPSHLKHVFPDGTPHLRAVVVLKEIK